MIPNTVPLVDCLCSGQTGNEDHDVQGSLLHASKVQGGVAASGPEFESSGNKKMATILYCYNLLCWAFFQIRAWLQGLCQGRVGRAAAGRGSGAPRIRPPSALSSPTWSESDLTFSHHNQPVLLVENCFVLLKLLPLVDIHYILSSKQTALIQCKVSLEEC